MDLIVIINYCYMNETIATGNYLSVNGSNYLNWPILPADLILLLFLDKLLRFIA